MNNFDYIWIGSNRKNIHIKAPKGSGGVGLLIKKWMFETYDIETIDNTYEGILGVKLPAT